MPFPAIQTVAWLLPTSTIVTLVLLLVRCGDQGRPFGSPRSTRWAVTLTLWIAMLCTVAGLAVLKEPYMALFLPTGLVRRHLDGSASDLSPGAAGPRATIGDSPEERVTGAVLGLATLGIQFGLRRLDAEMNNTIVSRDDAEGYAGWPLTADGPETDTLRPTLDGRTRDLRFRLLAFLESEPEARRVAERELDTIDRCILVARTTGDEDTARRADIDARRAYARVRRIAYLHRFRDQVPGGGAGRPAARQ